MLTKESRIEQTLSVKLYNSYNLLVSINSIIYRNKFDDVTSEIFHDFYTLYHPLGIFNYKKKATRDTKLKLTLIYHNKFPIISYNTISCRCDDSALTTFSWKTDIPQMNLLTKLILLVKMLE